MHSCRIAKKRSRPRQEVILNGGRYRHKGDSTTSTSFLMMAHRCSRMYLSWVCADVYKLDTRHNSVQASVALSSFLSSCLVSHQPRGKEPWVIRWQEVVGSITHKALHGFKAPALSGSAAQAPSVACSCVASASGERKQRTTH